MKKNDRADFPYALLRTELLLFLALLMLTICGIAYYPRICFGLGKKALQEGDEEKAAKMLERSDTDEAREMLLGIRMDQAQELIDAGAFEEALAILAKISITSPTDELVAACIYGQAMDRMDRGDEARAVELFSSIIGYRDAAEQRRLCEKKLAEKAFAAGDREAALTYARMNPQDPRMQNIVFAYRIQDARDLVASDDPEAGLSMLLRMWQDGEDVETDLLLAMRRCYPELYANADDDLLRREIRELDADLLAKKNRQLEAFRAVPRDVLAVGNEHTVLLRNDGTVLAAGDDSFGQCDVGSWTDVIAVAAGAYHTVGLRADGTVLATGDDSLGQCAVGDIRGAVKIAAHGFDTVVLCQDGAILSMGAHDYAVLAADWEHVDSLSLGGYALLGLSEQGVALATESTFLTDAFRSLLAIDAASTYAVGLTEEGRVVCSNLWQPDWENMVAVSAASTGIMGLRADGPVCFFLHEAGDYGPLLDRTDVVAIAFSGRHAAALLSDGTVLVAGLDSAGQCALTGATR